MTFQLTWAGIGIILAILAHAYHTVVWSAKITVHLQNLTTSLLKVDKELEKRDQQIAAAWRKLDNLGERMIRIELISDGGK